MESPSCLMSLLLPAGNFLLFCLVVDCALDDNDGGKADGVADNCLDSLFNGDNEGDTLLLRLMVKFCNLALVIVAIPLCWVADNADADDTDEVDMLNSLPVGV